MIENRSRETQYHWPSLRGLDRQVSGNASKDAEIRQLKRELARVTEERDILKKPPRISPGMQSEIRVRCRASRPVQGSVDVSVPAHPAQRFLCMAAEPADDPPCQHLTESRLSGRDE
jgi:hypothetical protein